jgi:hypothetical protein
MPDQPTGPNPSGLCMCGCGQRTSLSRQTDLKRGYVAGTPVRFCPGHGPHKTTPADRWMVDENGCWIWQWAVSPRTGYGMHKGRPAHRVVWQEHHGPLAEGVHLHHRCEKRLCVNPAHLEPISAADHVRHHRSPLTLEDAEAIRSAPRGYGTGRALAAHYGVGEGTICAIRKGRSFTAV